jgi:hypothetical protein
MMCNKNDGQQTLWLAIKIWNKSTSKLYLRESQNAKIPLKNNTGSDHFTMTVQRSLILLQGYKQIIQNSQIK